ncbi:hypothetical protein DAEQUDRAFT_360034 [Daedalea quercina L-15889]|uniref:Uncharacterized protein n=1 Tax=Daedalea quercina L-15889 TaxID=1314783 RepID=A0A165TST7_9APHY|nr:hypothetical protein DAEQUDRAFT_360034 [Daedalea quercina L-15889]
MGLAREWGRWASRGPKSDAQDGQGSRDFARGRASPIERYPERDVTSPGLWGAGGRGGTRSACGPKAARWAVRAGREMENWGQDKDRMSDGGQGGQLSGGVANRQGQSAQAHHRAGRLGKPQAQDQNLNANRRTVLRRRGCLTSMGRAGAIWHGATQRW